MARRPTARDMERVASPPKHVSNGEVGAFFDRVRLVRPDLALFVVDTALRLPDKVVPMLTDGLARGSETVPAPCRVERELWALGRHLCVVRQPARSDDEHRACHRGRSAGTASTARLEKGTGV